MARELLIQLARLGDLLQSLPAIAALTSRSPNGTLDLLCPSHLAPVARLLPGIAQVLAWDGAAWRQRAEAAAAHPGKDDLIEADHHVRALAPEPYDCAYVLNQHARALLAGALLARESRGPRRQGPLDGDLTPWAAYVRDVARSRRGCRVHLADAFCGLCGVRPPGRALTVPVPAVRLPGDLEQIGRQGGPWVGLVVGAGDPERLAPTDVWVQWMIRFLDAVPRGRVVLVGQERERAQSMQNTLPPSVLGRIWDATGRTTLPELAAVLARCHTVVGADTGPLHLAAAMGTRVIGWYFGRARVHETGPYGTHHLVWQARGTTERVSSDASALRPETWPIDASIAALAARSPGHAEGWSLWESHLDRWGAYYIEAGRSPTPPHEREDCWRELQPAQGE